MYGPAPFINCKPNMTDVITDVILLGKHIKSTNIKYDLIIGISRGGLIPAVMLSHYLGVSLLPIAYSASDGAGDNKEQTNIEILPSFDEGTKILIIDDICDTGNTLKRLHQCYKKQKCVVHTCALYYKDRYENVNPKNPKHGFIPTYFAHRMSMHQQEWLVFPWEDLNNTAHNMLLKQSFSLEQDTNPEVIQVVSPVAMEDQRKNRQTDPVPELRILDI